MGGLNCIAEREREKEREREREKERFQHEAIDDNESEQWMLKQNEKYK